MNSKILFISFFIIQFSIFLKPQGIPNDTDFGKQWYLYMPGNEDTRADIRVLDAWQRANGNSTQKIADIEDANGEYPSTHDDLDENRIIRQGQGGTFEYGHHSTMIAGIIMATHNTIGIAGINSYAKLYSYVFDIIEHFGDKIRDARLDGNKVINISQGQPAQLPVEVFNEIVNAHEHNIVTVVSVGNNNSNITNPATYSGVIAVGSSNKDNARSYFSNSGPQIKFLAPGGTDLSSTNINNIYSTNDDGSYTYDGGTSYAAPLVSGAASLILDYRSSFTNDDVLNVLINSCDKLPGMNGQNFTPGYGYGRINLKKAFELMEPPYQWFSAPATLNKTDSDINVAFESNPYLNTGIYIVDRYKLSYDNSNLYFQEPPLAWLERGYSNSNYNYSLDYLSVSTSTNSVHCSTYFYYVKYALDMTPIFLWFPYDPYTNTTCTIVGKIEPPTGIEDYLFITIDNPQLPYNVNQTYVGRQEANFIDEEPFGNYIVSWGNWKVYATTSCGNDVLVYESSSGTINIPPFPNNYIWMRDASNNVIGKIYISGTDNDNIFHEAYADITIGNVPANTFSGTLSSDVTWCGNITITGNLTVPENYTLFIRPGTNIYFQNNYSLLINGRLDAEGYSNSKIKFDRSGTTGTWGYIKFDGANSKNSILNYTEIKNGLGIQCYNGADVTVQNSLIDHCTNGIYLYNAAPEIISNTIWEPYGNGIYGQSMHPLIQGNSIIKTTNNLHNYQGIYLQNTSYAYIINNDIQGFMYGIYQGGGGTSWFVDELSNTPNVNNRFVNNTYGICAAWGSSIWAGFDPNLQMGKNNSIYNNTTDAYAYQSGNLWAIYNYWGADGAQTRTATNGFIDARFPLGNDPWYRIPDNDNSNFLNPTLITDEIIEDSILQCIHFELQNRIPEAISLCKNMILHNSHVNFSLAELIKIKYKYSWPNIKEYLDSLIIGNRPFKPIVMNYLATIALKADRYNLAMELYSRILNNYPNTRFALNALFEEFFATLNYKKDRELAGEFLSDLKNLGLTDEDFLMKLEVAESLYNNGLIGNYMSKSSVLTSENENPKQYTLLGNYPNPFNPSTNISYILPYISSVNLVIYDILGREIKSFNLSSQIAGHQSLVWDGTDNNGILVPSGIYLYRINIKSLENNKTFEKSSKLLMLK